MNIFKGFNEIYKKRNDFRIEGWIYVTEDDFEDLENATYYLLDEGECEEDDFIETEMELIPPALYRIDKSMISLIEMPTFQAVLDNMDNLKKEFTQQERIEALYHYIEEDTFLY